MTRQELSYLRESYKNDDQVVEILFDKLNDIERRICENCKYGELSWVATDGRDIRESQYPPMIECKQIKDKTLKYPNWYCADFSKLSLRDSR